MNYPHKQNSIYPAFDISVGYWLEREISNQRIGLLRWLDPAMEAAEPGSLCLFTCNTYSTESDVICSFTTTYQWPFICQQDNSTLIVKIHYALAANRNH